MSFSLPETNLYYLRCDDLAPESYERIISPSSTWSYIDKNYVFDDRWFASSRLINMQRRDFNGYGHQLPPHGSRERDKLKRMIYEGEVVMLDTFLTSSYPLFYINDQGELICRDPLTFHINGAENIIREYHRSVARRDYRNKGGKPRPTAVSVPNVTQQPAPPATINSKMAGRLLAAGGIYHQNPEKYAETAHKLGGAAAEGFDEVLNEQTLGSLVALSSIFMLGKASVAGHPSAATLAELKRYLGKTKGEAKLLDNITVVKLDYKRRDRDELARLRRQFQKVKPKFYKALAIHPTVKKRFNADELEKMAKGMRPNNEWEIHHKIPLDDGGTNNFQNLTLIHKDAHKIFTKAQKTITRQQSKHEVSEVLWAVPTGVVYP